MYRQLMKDTKKRSKNEGSLTVENATCNFNDLRLNRYRGKRNG